MDEVRKSSYLFPLIYGGLYMGKKHVYTVAGVILLALGLAVAAYPTASYYFGSYTKSQHSVFKKGSTFEYAGTLVTPKYGLLVYVYNLTYMGSDRFKVNASLYSSKNATVFFIASSKRNRIVGAEKLLTTESRVLGRTDPLIQTLFPKGSISVSSGNTSRQLKLAVRRLPFSFDFAPWSVGFPRIYTVNLPRQLWSYLRPVNYYRGNDRYFARNLEVVMTETKVKGQYNIPPNSMRKVGGLIVGYPIGINLTQTDLPVFFPDINWSFINANFPVITHLILVYTNIQPAYQDWWGEFKYSFVQYSAPVDYILILLGIVFLILAGRAGK